MKITKSKVAGLTIGLFLVAWLGLTPSGQQASVWVQNRLGASAMGNPSRYEIQVELYSRGVDDSMQFTWFVSRQEFMDADFFPRKISQKYVDMAKKRLAKKRGYYDSLFGEDSNQIEQLKVGRVILTDTQTDRKKFVERT